MHARTRVRRKTQECNLPPTRYPHSDRCFPQERFASMNHAAVSGLHPFYHRMSRRSPRRRRYFFNFRSAIRDKPPLTSTSSSWADSERIKSQPNAIAIGTKTHGFPTLEQYGDDPRCCSKHERQPAEVMARFGKRSPGSRQLRCRGRTDLLRTVGTLPAQRDAGNGNRYQLYPSMTVIHPPMHR